MSEIVAIPVPGAVLNNSVWITLNLSERTARLGFQDNDRRLNFVERDGHDGGFSVFVPLDGYPETATSRGVIGEAVPVPRTPRTAVVKVVGLFTRYHVVEIRGGWTAWVRP